MHLTALQSGSTFFGVYASHISRETTPKILEIGSQNINGSIRDVAPSGFDYIGVDFEDAKGVDVVLEDAYTLPFDDDSFDIVVSSSCFEHSEMFWLVFLEVLRVLKPSGLFYLNAPSAGAVHRYPVDCWRFYPDSGKALISWAKRNGTNAKILESYIQKGEEWRDFIAVFIKDSTFASMFPNRMLETANNTDHGFIY